MSAVKVMLDKRRTKCLGISMGKKIWNKKQQTKIRNIPSMQRARMNHAYCVDLNPGWKKIRFQLVLNKTFWPNPQPFTY